MFDEILTNRKLDFMGKEKESKKSRVHDFIDSHPVSSSIALSIIASILATNIMSGYTSVVSYPNRVSDLESNVSTLNETLEDFDSRLTDLEQADSDLLKEIGELQAAVKDLGETVGKLDDRLWAINARSASLKISSAVEFELLSIRNENFKISTICSNQDIIATDPVTGKDYAASELQNEKLLLYYNEGTDVVFFLGQYDDSNQWDGKCTTNVYRNNELLNITEGFYDHGKLLTYSQVFQDFDITGTKRWFVSNRENKGNYNSGKTSIYDFTKYEKNFQTTNVTTLNILGVTDFSKHNQNGFRGYYSGNTSGGNFNDSTGQAYYVGYADDGTIKTLYVGGFLDGLFEDSTHNAWMIGRDPARNTDYMYCRGEFKDGESVLPEGDDFEHHLTQERIDEILAESGIEFECPLNWYDFSKET